MNSSVCVPLWSNQLCIQYKQPYLHLHFSIWQGTLRTECKYSRFPLMKNKCLGYVIQRHNVKHHLYAKDTQSYFCLWKILIILWKFLQNAFKLCLLGCHQINWNLILILDRFVFNWKILCNYCNSVLFNGTEKNISKLQGVHSCLCDKVSSFLSHNSSAKTLQWLPVHYRIKIKLCYLTYQARTSG